MITIKTKQLLDGLVGTSQFMAKDRNRPNLTGVSFDVAGDRLELAATDTFTLGLCDLGAYYSENIYYVYIDETKVKLLINALKLTKLSDVNLHVYDTGVVRVTAPDTGDILFTANSDGNQFPKYRNVLPSYPEDRSGVTNLNIVPSRLAALAKIPSADRRNSVFKTKLEIGQPMEFTRIDDYGKGSVSSWRVLVMPSPDRK